MKLVIHIEDHPSRVVSEEVLSCLHNNSNSRLQL